MAAVLVVDDRATNRQFLLTLLGYAGHRLLEAADGAAALAIVRAERPDLVITDILMPRMDGFEFVRQLRADPALAATRVIFYSATYALPEALAMARACGVETVLPKPSEPQAILDAVAREVGSGGVPDGPLPLDLVHGATELHELHRIGDKIGAYLGDMKSAQEAMRSILEQGEALAQEHMRLGALSRRFEQNFASLQGITARLTALEELSLRLIGERQPLRMTAMFLRAAARILGAGVAAICVVDADQGRLVHLLAEGTDAEPLRGGALDRGGWPGALLDAVEPQALAADAAGAAWPAQLGCTRNLLGLPIRAGSHLHGWLCFGDKLGSADFDHDDARIASAMAAQFAVVYENLQLYDLVQGHAAKLQIAADQTRRRSEELHESEQRFRQMAESTRDVFFLLDAQSRAVLYVSPAYETLWGRSRNSLYAQPLSWADAVHAEDRERALQQFAADVSSGTFEPSYEFRIVQPAGAVRRIALRVFPIHDEAGRYCRAAGLATDVTEQRLAERARAQLAAIVDSSSDAIIGTTLDGTITSWNAGAERIYGYSAGEAIGQPATVLTPQDLCAEEGQIDETVKHGAAVGALETRRRRKDGSLVHVALAISPIRDADGRISGVSMIARDIGERVVLQQAVHEREMALERAQAMAGLGHCITHAGTLQRWSSTLPALIGVDANCMPRNAREWMQLVDPRDRGAFRHGCAAAAATRRAADIEYRVCRPADNQTIHVRHSMEPVDFGADGAAHGWFSTLQDVTGPRRAELRIARLNRVYAVLSGINTLIVRVRDRNELFGGACRIAVEAGAFKLAWIATIDVATQVATLAAWHGGEASQVEAFALPGAAGDPHPVRTVALQRAPLVCNDIRSEVAAAPLRHALVQAGYCALACFPIVVGDRVVAVLALLSDECGVFDAAELRLLHELAGDIAFAVDHLHKDEQLHRLAYYDSLTGVANGALLRERLQQQIEAAAAAGQRVALGLLDLEHFKLVNDTMGRRTGDALLQQAAARLVDCTGDAGHVARVGGDVFAVLMPGMTSRTDIAQRFQQGAVHCFGPPFGSGPCEVNLSARIGVAVSPDDGADAETLYRHAEAALKRARSGGERVLLYDAAMGEAIVRRMELEGKLRRALANEEFVLFYQPKVDLASRRVVAVEALLRWQSPELGLVSPGAFVPPLEETGLIVEVGQWVLRSALRQHQAWLAGGLAAPRIAVNVSALQLARPDFVVAVEAALCEGATPPGIDLEITESMLMADVESTIAKLHALHALGMQIAIDDFGTGYSSLAYLGRLPVQALKIDRGFVHTMLDDADSLTLVSTMIALAHSLRMKVVAEGVETEEQARMLRLLRCDQMQGYLFSPPVPAAEMTALIVGQAAVALPA